MPQKLIYRNESYAILGACFNVYKDKGCGFLEAVYHECVEIEFRLLDIPFESQKDLKLSYKSKILKQTFKPDFICYDKIIVELKAVSKLIDEHRAQLLNYLHASGCKLGILINFGHYPKLEYERIVH
jgi:GxxExxY protein